MQTHLILSYFEGRNLTEYLQSKSGRLGESEARDIVRKIAETLKYCHDQGISHRDIKPENVLINKEGRIKLIDFAYSTYLHTTKTVESYCGTPNYMSPEIFMKVAHCPKKSDIWALGVLAYKLVTGEVPFKGSRSMTKPKRMRGLMRRSYTISTRLTCSRATLTASIHSCPTYFRRNQSEGQP